MPEHLAPILLVEDSEDDIFFMKRACSRAGIAAALQVAEDGQRAIDYLAGKDIYQDRSRFPLPSLIILDLKLPLKSGLEVLQWIRTEREIKLLPVIVLTSSNQAQDVHAAYDLGANSYLLKPSSADGLLELMAIFKQYWLGRNILPVPFETQTGRADATPPES